MDVKVGSGKELEKGFSIKIDIIEWSVLLIVYVGVSESGLNY